MLMVQPPFPVNSPPHCTIQVQQIVTTRVSTVALRRPNARGAADKKNVFLAGFFTLARLAAVI